ncbi:amidase [Cerasicoccus frondis]|uniref:amidase n=1 Tax=Cerasicoccus frondis TaxID=490090 RepID=UPI0028527F2F|nr:amidase family protein [Cerasicoccus frondis]
MLTLEQWRENIRANPQQVADEFLAGVAALPQAERQAVFYWTPDRITLGEAMAKGAATELPLAGLPFGAKDLFDVAGLPTTAGSDFLAEVRSNIVQTSPVVEKLQAHGAALAAKVATVEFAYGMSGENAWYGDVPHPTLAGSLAGGSSNGSAYVVRRGLLPFSIGTDTSGSTRVPAAFCGLYSWRDTPAMFGEGGVFPLAQSFDTPGWFAADAASLQTLNDVMLPKGEFAASLRILDLSDYAEGLDPHLRMAGDALLSRLCATKSLAAMSLVRTAFQECFDAYNILGSTEAYSLHAPWLDAYEERYDPVIWGRINRGRHWTQEQFDWAVRKEAAVEGMWNELFADYDVIALPVTPIASPTKADMTEEFRVQLLSLNTPASLGRCPALTVPLFLEDGRSGGLQFVFRHSRKEMASAILAQL